MSEAQFNQLSGAIAELAITVGHGFTRMEARCDRLEVRLGRVEERLEAVEGRLEIVERR